MLFTDTSFKGEEDLNISIREWLEEYETYKKESLHDEKTIDSVEHLNDNHRMEHLDYYIRSSEHYNQQRPSKKIMKNYFSRRNLTANDRYEFRCTFCILKMIKDLTVYDGDQIAYIHKIKRDDYKKVIFNSIFDFRCHLTLTHSSNYDTKDYQCVRGCPYQTKNKYKTKKGFFYHVLENHIEYE